MATAKPIAYGHKRNNKSDCTRRRADKPDHDRIRTTRMVTGETISSAFLRNDCTGNHPVRRLAWRASPCLGRSAVRLAVAASQRRNRDRRDRCPVHRQDRRLALATPAARRIAPAASESGRAGHRARCRLLHAIGHGVGPQLCGSAGERRRIGRAAFLPAASHRPDDPSRQSPLAAILRTLMAGGRQCRSRAGRPRSPLPVR